jgi:hypothetical protein
MGVHADAETIRSWPRRLEQMPELMVHDTLPAQWLRRGRPGVRLLRYCTLVCMYRR